MADLWSRTVTLGTTLAGDRVRISFGQDNVGLLAIQAQINSSRRTVQQYMDLTTGNLHIVAGIPDLCQVSVAGVVASASAYKAFLEKFGNCCTSNVLTLTSSPGMCVTTTGGLKYEIANAVLINAADAVAASQGYMYVGNIGLAGIGPTITLV